MGKNVVLLLFSAGDKFCNLQYFYVNLYIEKVRTAAVWIDSEWRLIVL